MASNYMLLPRAKRQIREIVWFLAGEGGRPAAQKFLDKLEGQVRLACEHPRMWPLSGDTRLAGRGYRSFHVGSYLVLYVVRDDVLYVTHVFHRAQDYARIAAG